MTLVRWEPLNTAIMGPGNLFQGFDEALERIWGNGPVRR